MRGRDIRAAFLADYRVLNKNPTPNVAERKYGVGKDFKKANA